jgi:GNAT superfamily N-acetyltransferase
VLVDADLMAVLMSTAAGFGTGVAAAFGSVDSRDPATSQRSGSGALVAWGPGRYVNRAIGVSLNDLGDGDLDELESFFESRGVPPSIEVCSWASPDLIARLAERRFVPVRFNDLLVADPSRDSGTSTSVGVRRVDDASLPAWRDAFVAGFSTTPDEERLNRELVGVMPLVPGAVHVVAEVDGSVAGCGTIAPQGSVGWISGGATLPAFRRRGVQAALLDERLAHARHVGCEVAAATAVSGSASSRNMQRLGFTVAATILIMTRSSG